MPPGQPPFEQQLSRPGAPENRADWWTGLGGEIPSILFSAREAGRQSRLSSPEATRWAAYRSAPPPLPGFDIAAVRPRSVGGSTGRRIGTGAPKYISIRTLIFQKTPPTCHRNRFIHRVQVELPGLAGRCSVGLDFRHAGRGAMGTGRNDTTCVARALRLAVCRAIVNKGPIPNEKRELTGRLS